MINYLVSFEAPRTVGVGEGAVPTPGEGELLVETAASLISTGTELTALSAERQSGWPTRWATIRTTCVVLLMHA